MTPKEQAQHARQLARKYIGLGFTIVPLGADKRPVSTGVATNGRRLYFSWEGYADQRPTEKELAAIFSHDWWSEVRGVAALAGDVSGGLVVLDGDHAPIETARQHLHLLGLPDGYEWFNPSGSGDGWHCYVRCPDWQQDKAAVKRDAIGGGHVELRWRGSYTALPGSVHPSGNVYPGNPVDAPQVVRAAALAAFFEAVTVEASKATPTPSKGATTRHQAPSDGGTPYGLTALQKAVDAIRTTPEGGRNDRLNAEAKALGELIGGGELDRAHVEAALTSAALAAGLGESEIAATLRSALDAGERSPRTAPDDDGRQRFPSWVGDDVSGDDAALIGLGSAMGDDQERLSERIEGDLHEWKYRFSMSELDDLILCNGEPLSDALAAQIRMDARDAGYGGKTAPGLRALEDAYTALARQNRFHPVKDYLNHLVWDGGDDFQRLTNHFDDKHPMIRYPSGERRTVFETWLWRWMAGTIAKLFSAGAVRAQTPVLVLGGAQGLGKSTFAKWLASPLPDLFVESPIDPDNPDHERMLATTWIWELGEIGGVTRRRDREALKALITRADCTFRKPYGRYPVRKPAMASFIGTTNPEAGYLVDPTGNRRFLTVELAKINLGYATSVNVDQVWAQVMHHYKQMPDLWKLAPVEAATRDELNHEAEIERPFEGALAAYFRIDPSGKEWTPTVDIVEHLRKHGTRFEETQPHAALGAALRGMGLERLQRRMDGTRIWGYMGIVPREDLTRLATNVTAGDAAAWGDSPGK